MVQNVKELARLASDAANAGRWDEAERLWREVRAIEPNNPQALFSLGVHALQKQDFVNAETLIAAACAASPGDILARLTLSVVRRNRSDTVGEGEAIQSALAIDPYFLPALLAKGAWCERVGARAEAALYYRTAVRTAPPEPQWPAEMRAQLAHARDFSQSHSQAFAARLTEAVKEASASLAPAQAGRWREAVSIMAGLSRPYVAEGNQLTIPRLPAIPFFERAEFPWAAAIEAKTDAIRAELQAALAAERDQFSPYVAYKPGQPVHQWAELNHSDRWSAYHLWRYGAPVGEHVSRCPLTAEALGAVEMAQIDGLCPNALFSALAPHTHIPPHQGETNARVVAHLPLIVPDGCLYRVGFDERRWRVGEVLVFDDTIEHEARNDGDALRVVLIFDVWNPGLAPAEREIVKQMMAAARVFGAAQS